MRARLLALTPTARERGAADKGTLRRLNLGRRGWNCPRCFNLTPQPPLRQRKGGMPALHTLGSPSPLTERGLGRGGKKAWEIASASPQVEATRCTLVRGGKGGEVGKIGGVRGEMALRHGIHIRREIEDALGATAFLLSRPNRGTSAPHDSRNAVAPSERFWGVGAYYFKHQQRIQRRKVAVVPSEARNLKTGETRLHSYYLACSASGMGLPRCLPRSCPHAASMSCPRSTRSVTSMPAASRIARNRRTRSASGR